MLCIVPRLHCIAYTHAISGLIDEEFESWPQEEKVFSSPHRRRAETAKSRCSSTRRSSPSCNIRYSSNRLAVAPQSSHARLVSPRCAICSANRTLRGRESPQQVSSSSALLVLLDHAAESPEGRHQRAYTHLPLGCGIPRPSAAPRQQVGVERGARQTSRFSVDQIADPKAAHTQSFSEQEKELFQKYGKVPAQKNLLANKLKVRPFRIQLPTSVW